MKDWCKRHRRHLLVGAFVIILLAGGAGGIANKVNQSQTELEQVREENTRLQGENTRLQGENARLEEEITELTTAPNVTVEKWVKVENGCEWQKEVSAEKGDWLEFRIVINVTRTMNNVWVKDSNLASGPWVKVQDLQVDGISFPGDIAEGISLGKLTNESREITFSAQLSKSTRRYDCGANTLQNIVEAGDCGFEAAASEAVRITVDIHCAPPSGGGGDDKPKVDPPKVDTL